MNTNIGVIGITGRMGRALCDLIEKDHTTNLTNDKNRQDSRYQQSDFFDLAKKSDVIIDFSSPTTLDNLLISAKHHMTPLIIGTTGYSSQQIEEIKKAANTIPILLSYNFSLGVAICTALTKTASKRVGDNFKIEISETHHTNKKDIPSGTAIMLKEATGKDPIIHSYREGDIIGKHKIRFSSEEEFFEISHVALSRNIYTKGAIICSKYIINKTPKLYSIEDIFV